jgi:hypothetical protein
MSIKLPKIIAAYVQAQNAHDAKAMLACFSASAVVHDEGEKHSGKKAIGESTRPPKNIRLTSVPPRLKRVIKKPFSPPKYRAHLREVQRNWIFIS